MDENVVEMPIESEIIIDEDIVENIEAPTPSVEKQIDVNNLLFVGNSLVSGLDMICTDDNEFIAEVGLTLNKLKKSYFDDIAKHSCDTVVIGMGTNELGSYTEVGFKDYYTDLIEHIRSVNPDSVIICLSIPPVSERKSNNDELFNNSNVVKYNSYIEEICVENDVIFLDNTGYFGAVLRSDWTSDGIHLYGSIYKDWYNYLIEKISKF